MRRRCKAPRGISAAALALALTTSGGADGQTVVAQGYAPPVGDYIAYCDGVYSGLPYCNFTESFTVSEDAVAATLVMYDIGCASMDAPTLEMYYVIATWDTFEEVAESERITVVCTPGDPPQDGSNNGDNDPDPLAISLTELEANRPYFILQRATGNPRIRGKWGVAPAPGYQTSFQVLGPTGSTPIVWEAWRGAWDSAETYVAGDVVSFGGSSFISLQDNNVGNQPDVPTEFWDLVAEKGDPGEQGTPGTPGQDGDQGPIGPQGIPGSDGPQGVAGPQGSTGATGAQGPQGLTGAQGPIGPQGPTGPEGPQGAAGVNGTSGSVIAGNYANMGTGRYLLPWDASDLGVEANATFALPAGVASKLVVRLSTAPGALGVVTITIRKNETNTALSCTLSGSQTLCVNATDSVTFADGDLLSVSYNESNAAASRVRFGVQYNAP